MIGEDASFPNQIKCSFYQPANGKYIDWLPIWRILKRKKGVHNFSERSVDLIRHAWHLREKNFLNKNTFALPRLETLRNKVFNFNFEEYWKENIYRLIREKYFEFYKKNQNLHESHMEQYLDAIFLTIMENYEGQNLEYFLHNDNIVNVPIAFTSKAFCGSSMHFCILASAAKCNTTSGLCLLKTSEHMI